MPDISPLSTDDPRRLGGYTVEGLLAGSGVYLARDDSGDPVVIKVYASDAARFLQAMRAVRAQDAYYTAQVLDSGETDDGLPYLVTEYVDGEPLEAAVADGGPLQGAALHRLAIATMAALVAVHQAGAVHGSFGPGDVLLGPDGPRLINVGVAPALEATSATATQRVGGLAYTAPEHFGGDAPRREEGGEPAGAPADVFAWAATMVFAATGEAPFDGGSTSATMNRVLRHEPDLSAFDDHLRGVIADCLAKDPRARPTAGDALLKLVGHSLLTARTGDLTAVAPPPAGPEEPAAAPRRTGRFVALAVSGGLLIALASAGAVHTLQSRQGTPAAVATPTPSPSATAISTLAAQAPPSPPPTPTARITVPGLGLALHEHPADRLRVAAYQKGDDLYVRAPGTTRFTRSQEKRAQEIAASPDGAWLALFTDGKLTFVSRTGGSRFEVEVGPARRPTWSRDGKRLLLTTTKGTGKDEDGTPVPGGFAIVDVATKAVTPVDTDAETRQGRGSYAWLPDGTGVTLSHRSGDDYGMRIFDLAGRETRAMNWVGYTGGVRMFSPSGKLFLTHCPSGGTVCVWDTAEGVRRASVAIFFDGAEFWGWYDENHLLIYNPSQEPDRLVAMDLRSRERRIVLTLPGKDFDDFSFTLAER
ncbi:phosphotransferase [Nonomuraea sp. GTA35]|uniref:serine/threonine protein kinase n=1 Tax=Nonomuraea sp. GTA35 TaxID=1676746 RepID=UPI0035C24FCB